MCVQRNTVARFFFGKIVAMETQQCVPFVFLRYFAVNNTKLSFAMEKQQ
jgi:hypothetical protein